MGNNGQRRGRELLTCSLAILGLVAAAVQGPTTRGSTAGSLGLASGTTGLGLILIGHLRLDFNSGQTMRIHGRVKLRRQVKGLTV